MKKEKQEKKEVVSPELKDKAKKLEALRAALDKQYGEGAVFLGKDKPIKQIETIRSGSMTFDATSGIGGWPRGRIVEIFGPEASGKTTLTLHIIAEAQKVGLTCGFIDAEHALDVRYARNLGVDVDKLLISQPDYAEQALDIFKAMAESGAVDVLILDSVAALVPKAELEGEMGDQSMGVQARMMSKMMRGIAGILNKNNVLGVFINQIRMKIGVMYGNPETTTGGNALKFFASMRVSVRKGESIPGDLPGHMLNVKFAKNKLATPFTECSIPIRYGIGVDIAGDLFTIAKEWGVLDVRGAHSYFQDKKVASNKEEAIKKLSEDKELFNAVDAAVREELKKRNAGVVPQENGEDESEEEVEKE